MEFDLNVCLEIPEVERRVRFENSNVEPGFVKIRMNQGLPDKLQRDQTIEQKFRKHFLSGEYISRPKTLSWFQGLVTKVVDRINRDGVGNLGIAKVSESFMK